jgi:hypothetical protein
VTGPVEIVGPDNCPWHYRDPGERIDVYVGDCYQGPASAEALCDSWHLNAFYRAELVRGAQNERGAAFWRAQAAVAAPGPSGDGLEPSTGGASGAGAAKADRSRGGRRPRDSNPVYGTVAGTRAQSSAPKRRPGPAR